MGQHHRGLDSWPPWALEREKQDANQGMQSPDAKECEAANSTLDLPDRNSSAEAFTAAQWDTISFWITEQSDKKFALF